MTGWPFVLSAFYLTLLVAFTLTLVEHGYGRAILSHTLRRWGKFLLLLVVLGVVVQVLTTIAS